MTGPGLKLGTLSKWIGFNIGNTHMTPGKDNLANKLLWRETSRLTSTRINVNVHGIHGRPNRLEHSWPEFL